MRLMVAVKRVIDGPVRVVNSKVCILHEVRVRYAMNVCACNSKMWARTRELQLPVSSHLFCRCSRWLPSSP